MLKSRVIPCLDVKDGRVVKGVNFVALRDAGDPVEIAKAYDAAGADELCFLDITASHEKRDIILNVVKETAESLFMPLTVGGGVREEKDVRELLKAGADKVSINTAAVHDPDFVAETRRRLEDAGRPIEGLELYHGDQPLLEAKGLAARIEALLDPEIALPGGGALRIVAFIERPDVIEKILTHLDSKASEPEASRWQPCRAPPQRRLFD